MLRCGTKVSILYVINSMSRVKVICSDHLYVYMFYFPELMSMT